MATIFVLIFILCLAFGKKALNNLLLFMGSFVIVTLGSIITGTLMYVVWIMVSRLELNSIILQSFICTLLVMGFYWGLWSFVKLIIK